MDGASLVKEKIDVVSYIGNSVKLKKAGASFSGLCPFHKEKTPSFHVSPERQAWYCFGCQRGGDLISFVIEKEGVDFSTALELLAREAGIPIDKVKKNVTKPRDDRSYELLETVRLYYQRNLKSEKGKPAAKYLKEHRKLSDEQIEYFQVGFAFDSWEALGNFLLSKKYTETEIEKLGLIIRRSSVGKQAGWYDRFRNRVMFPIHDHIGRVVGFSGRTLSSEEKQAKYINSPESDIFQKGNILYGLPFSREAIHKVKHAVLVEGQLDVISLHGIGIKNVVAPQGTGFTGEQLKRISRYTERVVVYFDQDSAGTKAAIKAIKLGLENGIEVRVANVSAGKDPDEAAHQDPKSVAVDLREAVSFYHYLMNLLEQKDLRHNSSLVIQRMLPILAIINEPVTRESYFQKLADDTGVSLSSIQQSARCVKNPVQEIKVEGETASAKKQIGREILLWRELLAIFIQEPSLLSGNGRLASRLRELKMPEVENTKLIYRLAEKLVKFFLDNKRLELDELDKDLTESESKLIDLLSMYNIGTISTDLDAMAHSVDRLINQIYAIQLRREIKAIVSEKNSSPEQAERLRLLSSKLREIL